MSRHTRHRGASLCSLHRGLFWATRCAQNRSLVRVLPPLEVLLVRFEQGIHLEKAVELRNRNIILWLCHGSLRRNQSSTDRMRCQCVMNRGKAWSVCGLLQSGDNKQSGCSAKSVPFKYARFREVRDREKKREPSRAVQCRDTVQL